MASQSPDGAVLPQRRGAVAVILRGERFLVIRRAATVPAPGKYCFPGGGIEGPETEAEALVRELREELGVEIQPTRRLWRSVTHWRVELAWWHGEIAIDATLVPNAAEVESIHWLTAAEMLELDDLLESNRQFLQAIASGEIVLT